MLNSLKTFVTKLLYTEKRDSLRKSGLSKNYAEREKFWRTKKHTIKHKKKNVFERIVGKYMSKEKV